MTAYQKTNAHLAQQNKIARALSARAVKNLRKRVIAVLSENGITSLHVEWSNGERSPLEKSHMGRLLWNYSRIADLSAIGVEDHTNRSEPSRKARFVGAVGGNAENLAHEYYLVAKE